MGTDWYSIFIQQSSSVMMFWNVYIAVSIGLLGFVIQKGAAITHKDKMVFMIGFALFAISNLYPMYNAQEDLIEIYSKLQSKSVFSEPSTWPLAVTHLVFDFLILAFLYTRECEDT